MEIVELIKKGIEGEDTKGYYGTSIQNIIRLKNTGKLYSNKMDKYFYFWSLELEDSMNFREGLFLEWAKNDAEQYAWKHDVAEKLPFDPNIETLGQILDFMNHDFKDIFYGDISFEEASKLKDYRGEKETIEFFKALHSNNISKEKFLELSKERGLKGVIVALSEEILKDFTVEGDPDKQIYESSIILPEGLPIKYISGIKILDDYGLKRIKS